MDLFVAVNELWSCNIVGPRPAQLQTLAVGSVALIVATQNFFVHKTDKESAKKSKQFY
jgi:hypothetical protein